VLLAEDNPFNQAVLEDLLPRRGHTLRVAGDGRAALAALAHDEFDVLLLDIHMPELDGFEVIAAQRQREQGTGRHLPVIALPARSATGERARCLQAGMDDYLAKPVRAAELFAAIDRVVGTLPFHTAGVPGTGAEGVKPPDVDEPTPLPQPRGDKGERAAAPRPPAPGPDGLLDPDALLAACDGSAELLRKMCRHFRNFVPDRLAEIHQALDDRDSRRLREATHKLGGMVSSFSACAADMVVLIGRLGAEGKNEEAVCCFTRLAAMVEWLIARFDSLSVEQLRHWREKGQGA
jgi:CheY-like chemotaxis protein